MGTPKKVVQLVDRFRRNLDAYRSGKYNETQVRQEFINPFFIALGWDVNNEKGYAEAYKDVIHEDAIKIGGATKAPDYCFRSGGSRVRSPSHRLPKRKRPAHGVFPEGGKPVVVFVTVCTKDRRPWLATAECHGLLREVWTEASAWLVGRYVIMPDHVHLFASPDDETVSLEIWMRYWKRLFTQRGTNRDRQWQSGHWDRRLRNTESYVQKWDYVRHNPVRHGLVADPAEWLFQGEIHELAW